MPLFCIKSSRRKTYSKTFDLFVDQFFIQKYKFLKLNKSPCDRYFIDYNLYIIIVMDHQTFKYMTTNDKICKCSDQILHKYIGKYHTYIVDLQDHKKLKLILDEDTTKYLKILDLLAR